MIFTLINFSPSPKYLLVTLDALMLKNEKPDSVATAFASSVFPVPIVNLLTTIQTFTKNETWRTIQ